MRSTIRCLVFGHRIYIDDMGGALVQCCRRCPWTGRVVADFCAGPELVEKIAALNIKYGVNGIESKCEREELERAIATQPH